MAGPDPTDRRHQAQYVIPVGFDAIDIDRVANERCQACRRCIAGKQKESSVLEAAQAWHELEAEQMAECKAHVADAAGIDVVGFDGEIAAVIEQTVQNMDGFAGIGAHGNDVERAVLVGREPVEFGTGI